MPDSTETKHANIMTVLKWLVSIAKLNANSLAKALNLPAPTINRLLTGEVQDPRASTLQAIADFFDITVDQLLGNTAIIGSAHDETNNLLIKPKFSIPVLTMSEATEYEKNVKTTHQWFHWQSQNLNVHTKHSNIYAVVIKNSIYEPIFINESFLIINPDISPLSGNYVLVKFKEEPTSVVKKYISEGTDKYLYPIKSDLKTIAFNESEHSIIGVIIETYRCLRAT